MSNFVDKFVVYNLRATYHETGEYDFKVVLNPDTFKNSHTSELSLVDSDGRPIDFVVKKWGRKINCAFKIDETVADGVAVVSMVLRQDEREERCSFSFWIVK